MKTITFYSYKGGVGRSLILANIAKRLAEFGKNVCMLDFDLEAPGLPYKFDALDIGTIQNGVVDFICQSERETDNPISSIKDYCVKIHYSDIQHSQLSLIPAGKINLSSYWRSLSNIDWKKLFYGVAPIGVPIILHLKALIEREIKPDYLLVDSRTGISELSGIAIDILADEVVILLANNRENILGSSHVAKSILKNNLIPANNNAKKKIHFILSRLPDDPNPDSRDREFFTLQDIEFEISQMDIESEGLSIIHSDPELEWEETLKMDENTRISDDYQSFFDKLLEDDFEHDHYESFKRKKRAESLYKEHLITQDLTKRLQLLTDCILLVPENDIYYMSRARIYFQLGQIQKAIEDYNIAIEKNGNEQNNYSVIANFYSQLNRYEEALKHINKAIELNQHSGTYYAIRSNIYLALKKETEAFEDLKLALKLDDKNWKIHLQAAEYFFKQKNLSELAGRHVYRSLELRPNSKEALYLLAKIKLIQNNIPEFYLNLDRALFKNEKIQREFSKDAFFRNIVNEDRFQRILYKYNIKMRLTETTEEGTKDESK